MESTPPQNLAQLKLIKQSDKTPVREKSNPNKENLENLALNYAASIEIAEKIIATLDSTIVTNKKVFTEFGDLKFNWQRKQLYFKKFWQEIELQSQSDPDFWKQIKPVTDKNLGILKEILKISKDLITIDSNLEELFDVITKMLVTGESYHFRGDYLLSDIAILSLLWLGSSSRMGYRSTVNQDHADQIISKSIKERFFRLTEGDLTKKIEGSTYKPVESKPHNPESHIHIQDSSTNGHLYIFDQNPNSPDPGSQFYKFQNSNLTITI